MSTADIRLYCDGVGGFSKPNGNNEYTSIVDVENVQIDKLFDELLDVMDVEDVLDRVPTSAIIDYLKEAGYAIDTSHYVIKADKISSTVIYSAKAKNGGGEFYADSFWICSDGKPVCGWGDMPEVEGGEK